MPESHYDPREAIRGIFDAETANERAQAEAKEKERLRLQELKRRYVPRIKELLEYTVSELWKMRDPVTCRFEVIETTTVHKEYGLLYRIFK